MLRAAGGARLPQVGYGGSVNRQRNSFVLPEIGRINPESTTWGVDLEISWQVDLFGKLKRTQQSAWAGLMAEKAGRDAVLHTVVASVVRARVLVATAQRAVAIAREIRTSWESTANTVERRYRSGLVGPVDLYLARENLASARAGEVALEGQVEVARNALDVLVGRRPGSGHDLPDALPQLPDLDPVPTGLPAELLDRRPDLRQSELRLAASTYGIGIALADLYPSLSLTASGGYRSDTLGTLVSSDNLVYTAVANLVGPLFTGGQRRAGVDAARARTEQAAATYAGAVLRALREVEDALALETSIRDQLAHTGQRVADARAADRLARDRYQRGVETLLRVLETERRVRLAEESWITTQASLWNARIDLFLALGGDWEPDIESGDS
jgi:multidrug efflux system outer membrane protein